MPSQPARALWVGHERSGRANGKTRSDENNLRAVVRGGLGSCGWAEAWPWRRRQARGGEASSDGTRGAGQFSPGLDRSQRVPAKITDEAAATERRRQRCRTQSGRCQRRPRCWAIQIVQRIWPMSRYRCGKRTCRNAPQGGAERSWFNPWSLRAPRPGICLLGSCRRDICRLDICRPARRARPAEAVGGRQQPLFP
jgi:hypothetical protein